MAETTRIRLDKQIQKAQAQNMFPLSDANGELQYAAIGALVKSNETLTRLNSVEVTGGNLVIKYTAEDGNQQVVTTALNYSQTDIKLSDAKMDNPSSGVYRLILTESDGHTYPVDLSALLAVVTQGTQYFAVSGNGTPQNPLKIDPTAQFWNTLPHQLDHLDDVTVTDETIDLEAAKGGEVVLILDQLTRQWMPRTSRALNSFYEVTDTFSDLKAGNIVTMKMRISQITEGSIKVYRNGLRQAFGIDYDFDRQGVGDKLVFTTPFSNNMSETVIVDYRPAVL